MSPYLGEIKMFAGNFAPRGYAFCNGQLLSIAQNTALFSLLGTTYGGNGVSTFGLPDLRGRVPIHWGQGPGLSDYVQGEATGTEAVTLLQSNMPQHTHALNGNSAGGDATAPSSATVLAASTARDRVYSSAGANVSLSPQSVGFSGSSIPFSIVQPLLTVTFIIALQGIFPSRN
ncbi:MAG TPA: tail fiber protein [Usitatibacter sp.]|jgi:microcystin-dependent protein|nr:tail fiber protein [Usitatibacter sp.]